MPHPPLSLHRPVATPFLRNLMAYGASEVAAKASRLLVVVTVARSMEAEQIGLAAAALAAGDILKSLTQTGVGQRIIAAPETQLDAVCATARRIFTLWSMGLFALQLAIAAILYSIGASPLLAGLVGLLALEYLFMPTGLVQAALAMREGKLRQTAAIAGGQVVGANLMSALLALCWPGAVALVLPRILAAPIWLIAMRRLRPWRPQRDSAHARLAPFLRYGAAVLGIEVARALRLQSDKLLVGALMGPEVLGLYFLAFNAGLGLAGSFSTALAVVMFPHLCAATDRDAALRHCVLVSIGTITPAVLAQALLAPLYVPILFGGGWGDIAGIVSILCLVAIPMTLWSAVAGWLRANDRASTELRVTLLLGFALTLNTVVMAPFGLTALSIGYLGTASIVMLGASVPALTTAFASRPAGA